VGIELEEKKFPVPADIADIVIFLRSMYSELSDVFACESRDRIKIIAEDYKAWKSGTGSEPDWDSFRLDINSMCFDDGMPALFPDVE
jgi:hypothetical protein